LRCLVGAGKKGEYSICQYQSDGGASGEGGREGSVVRHWESKLPCGRWDRRESANPRRFLSSGDMTRIFPSSVLPPTSYRTESLCNGTNAATRSPTSRQRTSIFAGPRSARSRVVPFPSVAGGSPRARRTPSKEADSYQGQILHLYKRHTFDSLTYSDKTP